MNGPPDSHALPVPVRVDAATGAWSVDGQPMVLVPRHYWVFIQQELEQRVGLEAARAMLCEPGYRAAVVWCEREARTHGLRGAEVFLHYMKRMSERGYGLIHVDAFDPAAGYADVHVDHSVYPLEYGRVGRCVCYRFEGPLAGGVEFAARQAGATVTVRAREVECVSQGHERCRFEVRPATTEQPTTGSTTP